MNINRKKTFSHDQSKPSKWNLVCRYYMMRPKEIHWDFSISHLKL